MLRRKNAYFSMLSEIHKKSPSELNGLEDVLTGNFFGALRYTSAFGSVLYPLLSQIEFDSGKRTRCLLALMNRDQRFVIRLWPSYKDEGEIDLVIEFPDSGVLIGIEIKYNSELSSEDQLERYARYMVKYGNFKHRYLVFWAREPAAQIIFNKNKISLRRIQGLDGFGFFSWQKTVEVLRGIQVLSGPDKIILGDLKEYLTQKGLDGFVAFPYLLSPTVNPEQKYIFKVLAESIDFSSVASKFIITSDHYVFN